MATNPLSNTATLTIRLDADARAAFDRFAVGRGGRSALLRQVIQQTVQEIADRPFIDRPDGVARNRVSLRFTDVEIAVIEVREIGRASCRERVCQYVEISVVAVSLKKKKYQLR